MQIKLRNKVELFLFILYNYNGDNMKIIICGVGKLGQHLAKTLAKEEYNVTVIDNDQVELQDVVNNTDVNYVHGSSLDSDILIEAGAPDADVLISVMTQDEQNIMCSLLAKKLGVKNTIARIRTPEYTKSIDIVKEELGLSMIINPEALTADHIATTLSIPSALEATRFLKGKIEMISIKVKEDNKIVNHTMTQLSKKIPGNILICAIERDNETIIPRGNTKIQAGDKISITGTPASINKFLKYTGLITEKTKKVLICGGSRIAEHLAKIVDAMDMDVTIIDIDSKKCEDLSEKLPHALIINADASDQDVLFEEGIQHCDALISLTSIDEQNIVLSMFASQYDVPKIITKVNHIELDGVVEKSHIDSVVTPHKIANNQIAKYIRAMQAGSNSSCEAIYRFENDNFEMLEFKIKNDFKQIDTPIKNIKFKEGILIAAIERKKHIIIPTGADEIKDGDIIVVIDSTGNIVDINDILE